MTLVRTPVGHLHTPDTDQDMEKRKDIKEFEELHTPATETEFYRLHLITYNDSLGEPFAHSVKTLLALNRYY